MPTNTKEYIQQYYQNNKEKFKNKEYYCPTCKLTIKSNKSRI